MNGVRNTGSVGTVEPGRMTLSLPDAGFVLRNGGALPKVDVAYETYGTLSPRGDNAVYICHALTGDAHVAGRHGETDEKPGWWDEMVGPGKGIDTDFYFVVCANILGGCKGTTGPSSANPATGNPYGSAFPQISVTDIVNVQHMLLRQLGISRLAAVVGGSLGGMQALEWAIRHPEFVDRCICIAAGASLSAQALAFDVVARDSIMSDPSWRGGDYYDGGPTPAWGLAHARKIAHITYLSPEIMQRKFGRERTATGDSDSPEGRFQVENYLHYQGRKLVERFDANSYLRITEAMDAYDPASEFGSLDRAFAAVRSKFLVVALSSDWLFPPEQSAELANALVRAGKSVSFCTLTAPHGHDAFLLDVERLSETIRAFLPWVSPRGGLKPSADSAQAAAGAPGSDAAGDPFDEHRRIAAMVTPGARVLDLGCGDGELLSLLARERGTAGVGIDLDLDRVIRVMDRGHDALQLDLDRDLSAIPDQAYDYAILSGTLQQVRRPRTVVKEMLRVARQSIVAFPNFAHWRNRWRLAFRGRMPKSEVLPFEWYETPNIHLATLSDVVDLLRTESVKVMDVVCIPGGSVDRMLVRMGRCNLGAQRVLVRLTRSDSPALECGRCKRCRL